eukprot:2199416-Ditylum_brightwellii.AAC.1
MNHDFVITARYSSSLTKKKAYINVFTPYLFTTWNDYLDSIPSSQYDITPKIEDLPDKHRRRKEVQTHRRPSPNVTAQQIDNALGWTGQ